MTTTQSTAPKLHEDVPTKALFDVVSCYTTVWGFVALCLWIEHHALKELAMPEGPRIAALGVSTVAVFWLTVYCFKRNARVRALIEHIRYIAILAAAALLGAHLQAARKDESYESALRDGAVLACSKIATCKAAATDYANTH